MAKAEAHALVDQATKNGWVDTTERDGRVEIDGKFSADELEAMVFLMRSGSFDADAPISMAAV